MLSPAVAQTGAENSGTPPSATTNARRPQKFDLVSRQPPSFHLAVPYHRAYRRMSLPLRLFETISIAVIQENL